MAMRILMITGDQAEDIEVLYPYYRLREEGFSVDVASIERRPIRGKVGYQINVDLSVKETDPSRYIGLVLPGGRAPERLRLDKDVLDIVRFFFSNDMPVAAICHGPQILISAGVIRGRRLTGYPGIRDDIANAGAVYVDEPVVVDGNLVTSRVPSDMPPWMREYVGLLKKSL